jgi:hypothetical protein
VNTEDLVNEYLRFRNERDRITREFEEAEARIKAEMSALEAQLLDLCNQIGADSIKTPVGTVMRNLKERYWSNDWESFYKFVLEQKAVELLERRVHQTNMKSFLSDHSGEGLPPGIDVMREFTITVRKATSKQE